MTIVDSNVLLDIFEDDQEWAEWSLEALTERRAHGDLLINSVVYAEVSIGYERIEEVEAVIRQAQLKVRDIPREALFLAGKAFVDYRRRGGSRRGPLPDFFIGAHALVTGVPLLTRDAARFTSYFPTLDLIHPGNNPL